MIYKIEKETARDGSLIPVFANGKGVHSKYNPISEAIQAAKTAEKADFFVIIGLGGGYHIDAIQKENPNAKIIVVENEDIKNLLEIPCAKKIAESTIICTKEQIARTLLLQYNPLLFERFTVFSWRSWAQNNIELEIAIKEIISAALKNISADYSVQAHFGRHWHRNILENLKYLSQHKNAPLPRPSTKKIAAVVAAGPSLDESAERLRDKKYFVIATDTAFSALAARGIDADAVISIDAQNVSFKHFLCNYICDYKRKKPLCIFDLSSPPSSLRKARELQFPILFTISMHPLAQLAAQFSPFLSLESGAGTVTIAAADFARQIGFREIELFGADFSYSRGKPYTKGTYLDRIYRDSEDRLKNAETAFCTLMYRTKLKKTSQGNFTSAMLEKYLLTMEDFFCAHGFTKVSGRCYRQSSPPAVPIKDIGEKLFPFDSFCRYLHSETQNLLQEQNRNKYKNALLAHLPAMAAIKRKISQNNAFFTLLKLAYSSTVRYTT